MKPNASMPLFLACALAAALSGCDKSTAGGSDEIDTRLAVNPSGLPVAGARVVLVRSGDSTGQAQAISSTAGNGSFPDFQVPDGYYSVVVRDPGDSLGKYLDSVPVAAHKLPKGRDTLRALGRIRGVVRVGAGDSPATVVVGLIGTDILANVKANGTFSVELVPGGLYTLAASSSLQGYGTLYQRLSLKNGQDTLLSDTLALPFTALPTPAGLRVMEDTATGNVRVSWNRVVFPDLLGYVLERVEGGNVTSSQYLTDTVWTDSLSSYWESLPLLGPWPARNLAYRVRSRSVSGNPDSRSNAQTFQAVAPAWTKRVDSVKVTMVTDTVTGVTTLKWNAPVHPDLVGWRAIRTVGGVQDCSDTTAMAEWADDICADVGTEVIDSTGNAKNSVRLVREKGSAITYSIQTRRRLGAIDIVSEASRTQGMKAGINWRDSVSSAADADARFEAFGGWLLKRHISNAKTVDAAVSRDGVNWETIPHSMDIATGIGDSLWTGELSSDALHLTLRCRRAIQDWSVRTVTLPAKAKSVNMLSVQNGKIVLGYLPSRDDNGLDDTILLITSDSTLESAQIGGMGPDMSSMFNYRGIPISNRMRVDEINGPGSTAVSLVDSGRVLTSKDLLWKSRCYSTLIGTVGADGGTIVSYSDTRKSIVYLPPLGNAVLVTDTSTPTPSVELRRENSFVFRDEIWVPIDGHLWKGTLHLPSP